MNILIVTEYFPDSADAGITGGVESRSFYLGRELAKQDSVTILASRQKGQKRLDVVAGMKVIRCGPIHPYTNRGALLSRIILAFSMVLNGRKIRGLDIVEGNTFITYLPAFFIAKYHSLPSFALYNEVWIGEWIKNKGIITGFLGNIWERIVLNMKWSYFFAVSNFTGKKLEKYGISASQISIVPNGVDLSEIRTVSAEKAIKPTVCYIGRLTPQKRVEDLLRALNESKKTYPDIRCIIIGEGSERSRLRTLTSQLGIENDVDFMGYVEKRQEVLKLLKSSHIFCLPSIVEGFGIAAIEAAACGVPYVISDIEPLKEVTQNGSGGMIFKRMDHIDLSEQMVRLLGNSHLYDGKIKDGLELSESYDWKTIALKVRDLYISKS